MSSNREKGPDEVFCTACGEPIKVEAELCPHCGVRNQKYRRSSTTHDPEQYETTVGSTWWYGVAGAVGLWMMVFLFSGLLDGLGPFGGFLTLVAWVGMPIAGYQDMEYVRANSEWDPETALWVVSFLVFVVNVVAGVLYLYRRHEVLGEP
jgi:predicted RNA-binding Zn-ribbon protein involved in translation (DUF1610 family)